MWKNTYKSFMFEYIFNCFCLFSNFVEHCCTGNNWVDDGLNKNNPNWRDFYLSVIIQLYTIVTSVHCFQTRNTFPFFSKTLSFSYRLNAQHLFANFLSVTSSFPKTKTRTKTSPTPGSSIFLVWQTPFSVCFRCQSPDREKISAKFFGLAFKKEKKTGKLRLVKLRQQKTAMIVKF